jgi:hypothetical protein
VNCRYCGSALQPGALFCVECGRAVTDAPARATPPARGAESFAPRDAAPAPQPESAPEPEPAPETVAPAAPAPAPAPALDDEAERTRMMASRGHGERYVLQFSTGESVVVAGTGLIGRNPAPEPGEYVDELVSIFDVGKSVSKSHVEFGQDGGRFWVSDRYSTNGTVVRQPDADAVRCVPGKRYVIVRGTRVEIGEQFFIVS